MKGVVSCDKPRGAAKQALIRGFPNGETRAGKPCTRRTEHIGPRERTGRTETSQYPQEEKSKEILLVAASERGIAQTLRMSSLLALFVGGRGTRLELAADSSESYKT